MRYSARGPIPCKLNPWCLSMWGSWDCTIPSSIQSTFGVVFILLRLAQLYKAYIPGSAQHAGLFFSPRSPSLDEAPTGGLRTNHHQLAPSPCLQSASRAPGCASAFGNGKGWLGLNLSWEEASGSNASKPSDRCFSWQP